MFHSVCRPLPGESLSKWRHLCRRWIITVLLSTWLWRTLLSNRWQIDLHIYFFNVSTIFLLFAIKNTSTCFSASDMEECEFGWEKFQGFCYHHFSIRQSWETAEQHCRLCGGHLLSLMTPEEQDYINGKIWIKRRFPVMIRWHMKDVWSVTQCTTI